MKKLRPRVGARQYTRAARMARLALVLACGSAWAISGSALAQPEGEPAAPPTPPAPPPPPTVPAASVPSDKPELMVGRLEFQYSPEHPNLPPMDELLASAAVQLVRAPDGFIVTTEGREEAVGTVTVGSINEHLAEYGKTKFSVAAVEAIFKAVAKALTDRQLIGVLVTTVGDEVRIESVEDGSRRFDDRRDPEGELVLRGRILIPIVTGLRTVAAGDRLGPDEPRINNPRHERILRASPLQRRPDDLDAPRNDLLLRNEIDDFVFRLNRHPGRRVDVALSNAENEFGAVVLDYLVRENKPWIVYLQASNTGTEQTDEWRERAGFIHNQLLDNDDTFQIDFITGGFDSTNIVNASYSFPLTVDGRLRTRIYGGYSEFDASEVGQSNENFNGSSYQAGGELSYNVFQYRELFLDVYAGGRFQNVEVVNNTLGVSLRGETDFALLGGGVRLERTTETATTNVDLGFDVNASDLAGTDPAELTRLGRLGTQEDFTIFRFSAEQTLYLEPIFDADNYRRGLSTLAHEVAFSLKGQATSDRVAPSFQQVAGGLYTVRGYDESAAAGDTVVIFSAEYRLHIPRLLSPQEPGVGIFGEEFRYAPQQPYGRPDWDLIVRAFFDAAETTNSDRLTFEQDESLASVGVGIELVYKRNLNIRVDWGSVLEEVGTGRGRNEEGDNRFHFSATFLF
ncbi:MAG: ShlB/FhaC/HecB family hemolysin secretion/activation protein [Phycisphaerales bacterium]